MTATFTQKFIDWMDRKKLRAEDVAQILGISAATVRNWRSSSIPSRRKAHVQRTIDQWDSQSELAKIILRPTELQFRSWNRAAIATTPPLTIEDWARDGLDDLAAQEFPTLSKVAEPEKNYPPPAFPPHVGADIDAAAELASAPPPKTKAKS